MTSSANFFWSKIALDFEIEDTIKLKLKLVNN